MRDPQTGASRHDLPPRAGLSNPGAVRRTLAPWFSIEHPPAAEWADYIVYGVVVAALALYLVQALPLASAFTGLFAVLLGWLTWSGMEYGLHRYVLHHWPPFSRWHADHHARPKALLGAPTLLSLALFAVLVFLPAWLTVSAPLASAFTIGVLLGYLGYAATHHAVHHGHGHSAWLVRRKRWHALHHGRPGQAVCFGVTTSWWDQRCHTMPPPLPAPPTLPVATHTARGRPPGRSSR